MTSARAQMPDLKRITVYLDADLHRALRLKGAESDRSVSDLINGAVRDMLIQDAMDIESLRNRRSEPAITFEGVIKELRRRGKL
jgi:hypothetical protein